MTWGNPPKLQSATPKPSKIITPEDLAASGTEDGHQAAIFCWSAMNINKYPDLAWLHSIPNGGSRHIAEATKMVAAGLRSGVWDIFLPCPIQKRDYQGFGETFKYGYHGLYIEMKHEKYRKYKDGGLTEEQVKFGEYAIHIGYYCKLCYSWIEAKEIIIAYLELKV